MARESVVSREFTGTKVTFMGLNTDTLDVQRIDYTFSTRMTDDEVILKQLTKAYKGQNIVPGKIIEKEDYTVLLAMKTEDFIKQAFELDPETRKRKVPLTDGKNEVQSDDETDVQTDDEN